MTSEFSIEQFLSVPSSHSPSFNPSGSKIVYLNNCTGIDQAYQLDRSSGDTRQLTFGADSIEFVYFSPVDDDLIIFGSSASGNEKTQLFLLSIASGEIVKLTDSPSTGHHWGGWSADGRQITFASNERNGTDFDIYIMNCDDHNPVRIFSGSGWCSTDGFSPSGQWIVVIQAHTNTLSSLYLVSVEGSKPPIALTSNNEVALYSPINWRADETGFYYVSNYGTDKKSLRYFDLSNQQKTSLLESSCEINLARLSPDNGQIALLTNVDGYSFIETYHANDLKPTGHTFASNGVITSIEFSPESSQILFDYSDYQSSGVVQQMDLDSDRIVNLTQNQSDLPAELFSAPELVKFRSFDNLEVPAFIVPTKGYSGDAPPAIIHIHGGPEGQFRPGWAPLIQYFAYSGFSVIAPNVRGSSGYGKKYMALDDIEKRMDSVNDLGALHSFISEHKIANSSKIVLYGGSYGGYMVLAGLAFLPQLWAAGVDIVGIANLVTFLQNTSSYRRKLRESEYGSLERDADLLWELSPIRRVEDIAAPLLIIHGANDPRVPLSEAELIHAKMTELGKVSELLVYPDEGHGLRKLKNRLDAYPKVMQFLKTVLNNDVHHDA